MVCPGSHTSTHAAERDISNEIDESHNTEYIGIRNTHVYQRRTKQFGVRVDIELKSARTKRSTYNHMTYASSPSKSIQMLRHEAMHAKNCKQLLQRMRRTSSWSNPSPCCCITIPYQSRVYNASKVLDTIWIWGMTTYPRTCVALIAMPVQQVPSKHMQHWGQFSSPIDPGWGDNTTKELMWIPQGHRVPTSFFTLPHLTLMQQHPPNIPWQHL